MGFKKIHYAFIETYKKKPVRGSSYIPTPEKYINPKCGLINIQNEDQECFRWCMKYHQSLKDKNSHRITVLKKVDDNYNYENVNFPASLNDIEQFELNNKLSVFVYSVNDKDGISRN